MDVLKLINIFIVFERQYISYLAENVKIGNFHVYLQNKISLLLKY